jgi:hypothetical protein
MFNSKKLLPGISVVIPTIGGEILYQTIKTLNSGSYKPDEILVIIPRVYENRIDSKLLPSNSNVFFTEFSGQVSQRIFGFTKVKYLHTLQLDDDLFLNKECLKILYNFSLLHQQASISPTLLDVKTNNDFHFLSKPKDGDLIKKFLFFIINGKLGYVGGKISEAGLGMGFDTFTQEPNEVEWLPGGCVLHYSPNLIVLNFYPFSGKAYSEDLYHSFYLKSKQIKLYHIPSAFCYVDCYSSSSSSFFSYINIVVNSTKSLLMLNKITHRNNCRLLVFQICYFFIYLPYKKLFRNFK